MKRIKVLAGLLLITLTIGCNTIYAADINNASLEEAFEFPEEIQMVGASRTYVAGDTKVSILGDSVSTYDGYTDYGTNGNYYRDSNMPVEDTWWMGLLIDNNWSLGFNESLGGSCVERTSSSLPYMASDMRIEKLGRNGDPDKIFIFGGLNDILSLGNTTMGDYHNVSFGKDDTFADAYYTMIKKIEARYPNAEITCLIPYDTIWAVVYPEIEDKQKQVPEIISGICNQEGIKYIDLRDVGLDVDTDMVQKDLIHPNENGMKKIKSYIEGTMVSHYSISDGTWDGTHLTLQNGEIAKDCFFCDGSFTYYLQHDGTPMKNRLTYHPDGKHIIYFDENGHEVFSNFKHITQSISGTPVDDMCFFDVYGHMYVDVITYDQAGVNLYYANPCGVMEHNGWFTFSDGNIGYANPDCTLVTNQFGYDDQGRMVYFQGDGKLAKGVIFDGTTYYHMDETDGHLLDTF